MSRLVFLLAWCVSCAAPPREGPAPPVDRGDPRCLTFPTCSVDTTCSGSTTCISVKSCAQPICVSAEMACTLQCGGAVGCSLLESYPSQVACPR